MKPARPRFYFSFRSPYSWVGARKIEAQWRQWSARWKGVESAITRFCAQTELTPEQALMREPPHLIEDARDHLHPKSRVDRAI